MTKPLHALLKRQLKKQFGSEDACPAEIQKFVAAINDSYYQYDEAYHLLDRSMQISNEEFLVNNRILSRKNEMLDAFVYRVSHDLKSPTINILSMLKMFGELQSDAFDENPMLAKLFSHLTESANLLQVRIADLLELSRQENVLEEKEEEIDFLEIMEKVQQDLSIEIQNQDAKIQVDFEDAKSVMSGRENMFSLLSNLLSNAVKYRSPKRKPVVKVRTYQDDHHTVLEISDNGLGIDLEKTGPKLFGMFNRFHDHVPGTGVGLYIVKKIIENSGGKIEVKSQLDVGTTFIISFANAKTSKKAQLNITY